MDDSIERFNVEREEQMRYAILAIMLSVLFGNMGGSLDFFDHLKNYGMAGCLFCLGMMHERMRGRLRPVESAAGHSPS